MAKKRGKKKDTDTFTVVVSYSGAINVDIEVSKDLKTDDAEELAIELAEGKVQNMSDKRFLQCLEPQHTQSNVIAKNGENFWR